jgi:raffinose/stachyose/melibiose transport system permease protein
MAQSVQRRLGPVKSTTRAPWHVLLVCVGPAFVIYFGLMIVPIANPMRLALYHELPDGSRVWAGLANLARLFHDPTGADVDVRFLNALGNTTYFFAFIILIQTPIALTLAALLSIRGLKGASFFRTVFFVPATLSFVISGWIWSLMFNPTWGVIYAAARSLGVAPPGGWLGTASTALSAVALVAVWQFVGMPMILFLAAFLSIEDDLIDAARIDGASGWQTFCKVRLPLVLPTVGLVVILTFTAVFVAFDIVFVMEGPQAGPGYATDVLGTLFYRVYFGKYGVLPDPSMGSAIAAAIFIIVFTVVIFYLAVIRRHLVRT